MCPCKGNNAYVNVTYSVAKQRAKQLALAAHSIQYTGKASQQASKLATNNLQFSNNM